MKISVKELLDRDINTICYRECHIETQYEKVGVNVTECNPTSETVCVQKIRYVPEEYLDDECTTTTEEVCRTNYVRTYTSSILLSYMYSMLRTP